MRQLRRRLRQIRWLAAPLGAYLTVTLALPVANGAAGRPDFGRHAGWVVAGCVAAVALALLAARDRDKT